MIPYSETLIGLDAQTNERIPRLAKSWESTPDGRVWTFQLEEGVPLPLRLWRFHLR